jgi:hypothetical protein
MLLNKNSAFYVACFLCPVFAGPVAQFRVGTPASILSHLPKSGTPSHYTFSSLQGEPIEQKVDGYEYVNGRLSMWGDSEGSDFILKGDEKKLYGWVVRRDKNLAYEYNTGPDGQVYVKQVSVEDVHPVCDPEVSHASQPGEADVAADFEQLYRLNKNAPEEHLKPWNGQDLYKLQSLPGSDHVLFLDIEDVMDGDTPKYHTKEKMYQAWQIFASTYSMFDLNVTTDPAVHQEAGRSNSGINHLEDVPGRSHCCVGCFGTGRQCETQLRSNSSDYPYVYGKTMAHESGHGVGLRHDGNSSSDYFGGFSDFEWSPTMGSNTCCKRWQNALPQWSKGEYSGANQDQDDLERILDNPFDYRPDDIPSTKPLVIVNGEVDPADNRGQINTNTDSDIYTFTLERAGRVQLQIERTEPRGGSALDVDAALYGGTGNLIARDNPVKIRSAGFDRTLSPGSYRLSIQGGAEGTPSRGFSNYATMGFYAISGTIEGVVGIRKLDLDDFMHVSQGPNAEIRLEIPENSNVSDLQLVSTGGRVVFHSKEKTSSIDLSAVPAGIYFFKMLVDGRPWVRKILKN